MIVLNYMEENDFCRWNLDYPSIDFVIEKRHDLGELSLITIVS